MPPVTYTWHIEDRRVRCTLDYVEFKKGLRKTLPPKSYYDLTSEQIAKCHARGDRILI